jgi:branched-subunit amino acid transport protein AzlD
MKFKIIRQAFIKSLPVMAGYIVLSIGFGILLKKAGYGVIWSFCMSAFIYLGRVLPAAIIGMLVIYCLKDITLTAMPYGIPELIAAACTVLMQVWKRSSLLSILAGTAVYMILIQTIF